MSFFDDASLAFLPSSGAGKDGKAYSVKPTTGDGDFTFSRGSNLAATRVGADGLIEKGRENLLLRSNEFDTTWTVAGSTVTDGQSGYDGSNNAWLLSKSSASGNLGQNTTSNGVTTFSVYAKANASPYLRLIIFDGTFATNGAAYFDLQNGALGTTNAIDSSIESVGSGWYRCSVSFNTSNQRVYIYPAEANSTTGASGSIYIQDAQLEIGLAATDYIETGATTGKAGLLEDEPRFDYSGGATCPSLLLEGSRTNVLGYSEYFGDSYWTKSGTSVVSGFTSPEGLSNAYKLVEDSNNSTHFINSSGIVTPDTTYSSSVYIKPNDRNKVALRENSITGHYASFDLSDGTLIETTGVSASIESVSNGWYRIDYQVTSGPSYILGIYLLSDSYTSGDPYSNPYQGDGTSGVYIYGAQLESGSYPTSYIPNHSGGSVTRGADYATKTGVSDLIGQTEGSAYLEIKEFIPQPSGSIGAILSLHDGGSTNRIGIIHLPNTTEIQVYVITGGASQALYNFTPSSGVNKIAIGYANNDIAIAVNGAIAYTDTSATIPSTSAIGLNTYGFTNIHANDSINQVLLFKERLSNADLETLTTL